MLLFPSLIMTWSQIPHSEPELFVVHLHVITLNTMIWDASGGDTVNLNLQLTSSAATMCSHLLLWTDPFIGWLCVQINPLVRNVGGKNSSGCGSSRAFMAKDYFVFWGMIGQTIRNEGEPGNLSLIQLLCGPLWYVACWKPMLVHIHYISLKEL